MTALYEAAQRAYEADPDVQRLIDESVIDVLGLTSAESTTLSALLATRGNVAEAESLSGLKPRLFASALNSLVARELIAVEDGVVDLVRAAHQLRVQLPEELEDEEQLPPPVRVVFRPITEQVISLARSGRTPVQGLARVYSFLYGDAYGKYTFGQLGIIVNALGLDRAALFLLEHSHKQTPLSELVPLARAIGAGVRPAKLEQTDAQRLQAKTEEERAWKQRMRVWMITGIDKALEQATDSQRTQIEADVARYRLYGSPALS